MTDSTPTTAAPRPEGTWFGGDPFCDHTGPDDNGFCITCGASWEPPRSRDTPTLRGITSV